MIGVGVGLGFGGAVPVVPIDPTKLSNVVAWYRTDTIVLSSSTVTSWTDKSGNGHAATSGFGSLPRYSASGGAGGNPRVICDGTDQLLTGVFVTPTQPFEVFAVVTPSLAVPAARSYLWDFGAPGAVESCWQEAVTGAYTAYDGTGLTGAAATATPTVVNAVFNGASSKIAINGHAAVTGDAGNTAGGSVHFALLNYYGAGQGFVGDAYEFLLLSSTLSPSVRAGVALYLKRRYGIS